MSKVTVTLDGVEEAQAALNHIKGGLSPFPDEYKKKIAETIRQLIYQRTLSGRDRYGQPFAPYSPFWSATKGAMGSTKVNLYFTGHMFGNMQEKIDNDDAVIYFADDFAAKKAAGHIEGKGRLPVRDFFFLTEEEVQAAVIRGVMEKYLDDMIRTAP